MGGLETFLWGLFGGFGAEAVVWFGIRHQRPRDYPYWLKSPIYYLVASVMVLVGGIIAVAYSRSGTSLNAILAIQIGASAPLILRKARDVVPDAPALPDPERVN